MKNIALLIFSLGLVTQACVPPPATPDGGQGGSAQGGSAQVTGGAAGSAGQAGAGCPVIAYPDTPVPPAYAKKAVRRKLPPRHFRAPGRRALRVASAPQCSGGALPLVRTPLDQVDGSCTGAASVGEISSPPFPSAPHFNIPDSLLAYQGGTCVDQGCVRCSCKDCPGAYCPATHANDTGSTGSSVATWMVAQGWLRGFVTVETTDALLAELATGKSCVIGVDWRRSMWDADLATGEIKVDLSTPLEGGHELHAVLSDLPRGRVWARNSWGAWGWCYHDQVPPGSKDGTGCGYGWIAVANLPKLRFDADCPEAP